MARSQESFSKKEREKKKQKKRQEKLQRKEDRKSNEKTSFDDMIAYVDENGNITDTPPDPKGKKAIDPSTIEIGVPKKEDEEPQGVRTGKVVFFNDSKGYGFLNETGSQERIFVHINDLEEEVTEGDKVNFEIEQGPKGLNAVRVKKA